MMVILFTLGCASLTPVGSPAKVSPVHQKLLPGYLQKNDLPDSLAILPPPPGAGSAAFAADQEAFLTTRGLRNTERWALAARDADLHFPAVARIFSCALEMPITEEATPQLYNLLRRSRSDAGQATARAKDFYKRPRPFVVNKVPTCAPHDESKLTNNGSYPSGHTAIGWTWALILAETVPERRDAILARGLAFGQSRVICGVHWQSDIEAGMTVAAGVVARLHADPAFRSQLEAAKAELAAVRARGLKPDVDCIAEAGTLSVKASPDKVP